jgi:S1-C subfamily serine protease
MARAGIASSLRPEHGRGSCGRQLRYSRSRPGYPCSFRVRSFQPLQGCLGFPGQAAEHLGYPENTRGVLITKVTSDGLAAGAGLRRGMVVTKVDKKSMTSAKALKEALAAASLDKGVLLQVQSPQGGTNYVLLKSGAAATP